MVARNVQNGFDVRGGTQQTSFFRIQSRNWSYGDSKGFGFRIFLSGQIANTTIDIYKLVVDGGFADGVVLGDTIQKGGVSNINIIDFVVEHNQRANFRINSGGPYKIMYGFTENRSSGARDFIIGAKGTSVLGLTIAHNMITGVPNEILIDGIGWRGLTIRDNIINNNNGIHFLNSGGGLERIGGVWDNNKILEGTSFTEVSDPTGFEYINRQNASLGAPPDPDWKLLNGSATLRRGNLTLADGGFALTDPSGLSMFFHIVPSGKGVGHSVIRTHGLPALEFHGDSMQNRWVQFKQRAIGKPTQTFSNGDETPSVAAGNVFRTRNTTKQVTITDLDDGLDGQFVTVIFRDTNTTIDFSGSNLKGNSGNDWSPKKGDHMTCAYDGSHWYCDVSEGS